MKYLTKFFVVSLSCCLTLLFIPITAQADIDEANEPKATKAPQTSVCQVRGPLATIEASDAGAASPEQPSFQKLESADYSEPIWMTGCTAHLTCYSNCSVSCNGTGSCDVGSDYVECDGNRTYCYPPCSVPPGCAEPCTYCDCKSRGFTDFQCNKLACVGPWS